ncbi:hypothetical protein TWF102_000764 [Orbilia oligospora]|uniref:Uncharacterized protein n=1 Tax=Orbilia oligospora TaxID=2813651 RepID=A0A7C8J687_ORBOL|nr:hypothetical protein TWF102_000764 [Orbilia oligospora]KAF3135223.1 hypothetical protein TWF703_006137 [Orbilia oligospora]
MPILSPTISAPFNAPDLTSRKSPSYRLPVMVRTQFLGHERYGYGLLADSERIDIFVVPTPTMTNSFVNIRRRTQPSSNL